MASTWRRCVDCGVYFERAEMHPDPNRRLQFGRPGMVCSECHSRLERSDRTTTLPSPKRSANH